MLRPMIDIKIQPNGVVIIRPTSGLSEADFDGLNDAVDAHLASGGRLSGLVIDAPSFPGWASLSGLVSHVRFVKDHHRLLSRVAFVSDNGFLQALPKIGRHFVQAEVRHFDGGESEEAIQWVSEAPENPDHALRWAWFPEETVMWVSVDGKVTSAGYRKLLDEMEEILKQQSPISFLVNLENLDDFELGAMMADMRFGFSHLKHFKRIALVGHEGWIRKLAGLPNPFSVKVKAFTKDEEEGAWNWLSE